MEKLSGWGKMYLHALVGGVFVANVETGRGPMPRGVCMCN